MASDPAPDRGDLVWLDFDPQAGHEQAGHRPALVLSRELYNRRAGLALVCPVTSQAKGYPMEVSLPAGFKVRGVVLADQVRNIEWRARRATHIARAPESVIAEALAKVLALLS